MIVRPKKDFLKEVLNYGLEIENQTMILKTLSASFKLFLKLHEYNNFKKALEMLEIPFISDKDIRKVSEKLGKSLNYSEVVRLAFQEVAQIDRVELKSSLDSLIEKDDLKTAAFMLRFYRDFSSVKKLWEIMLEREDVKLLEELLKVNIAYLVNERKWDNVLNFLNNLSIYEIIPEEFETPAWALTEKMDKKRLLHFCLVYLAITNVLD